MTTTFRPTSRRRAAALAAFAGLALITSGCDMFGGDGAKADAPGTTVEATVPSSSTPATTVAITVAPSTLPSTLPTLPATTAPASTVPGSTVEPTDGHPDGSSTPGGLDAVAAATVRIYGQGTFVEPDFGVYEMGGTGSGFIIDDSGIVVTNNHVVAGSGLIQVYVPGEEKPRNAKVLGVSECSDLAVIDLEGDGYPTLSWYEGDVAPGLDVYAAGYPLSDPEYTLTSGIVAKADANGETGWASVDHVLEHDAAIQPGNSGGPLVTKDGEVVGIDYASWGRTNTDQYFAIEAQDAESIIEELRAGNDVDSLGINGQAVVDENGNGLGIWVSGVTSGSPADLAGIMPGDMITRFEGVSVGTDGTMADYCDVMRTHNSDDAMSVEVVRYATQEYLTGQFNGAPLTTSFSFEDELGTDADAGADYSSYVLVTDDSGTLSVSVPAEWADVDGSPVEIDGVQSPSIIASSSVDGYNSDWTVPGVQFVASSALAGSSADDLLDLAGSDDCVSAGRQDYEDGVFSGRYESFTDCGGSDAGVVVVAAFPEDGSYGVLVAVQVTSDADLAALDEILNTFDVIA